MSIVIGFVLALLTWVLGRFAGFDRDRAFYPTVLIAIATYDVLFALMAGSTSAIVIETILAAVMVTISIIGFRVSAWIVAVGFAAHGIADYVHDHFSPDAGIPAWWPAFCGTYDVVLAVVLALQLGARSRAGRAAT